MFDHVTIRVSDRAACERFYTAVLAPLGIEPTHVGEQFAEWADFSLASADDEHPVTRGLHVGFGARTRELAAEFWRAGTAAGYRDERAPGPRPEYGGDYFGAFLLDLDGKRRGRASQQGAPRRQRRSPLDPRRRRRGLQALLDACAARRPAAQQRHRRSRAVLGCERLVLRTGRHPHRAAAHGVRHGGRRRRRRLPPSRRRCGLPRQRRSRRTGGYHAGYYSAFVLDPDGNSIELVNHNR